MQNGSSASEGDKTPAKARGRPRAFDRTAALDNAMRLFWAKGYEATSIADLTEAMRIGSPSLYAAFRSKEALYAEALQHYCATNEHLVWDACSSAQTARAAVAAFLADSAAALADGSGGRPLGCMVTLSSVDEEEHAALGKLVCETRAVTARRLEERFGRAIAERELPQSTDVHALARFVQAVQSGMSILARDGATREDLESIASTAMLGWDARVSRSDPQASPRSP